MAQDLTNQTPQSSPITVPGESVTVTAQAPQVETLPADVDTVPQTIPLPQGSTIRNFRQTAQEREVIKTAPDIVVYLDGLPYIVNHYLNDPNSSNNYIIVNFNDHVQSFNASYDTDNLVPSGSINLSIPAADKKLYQIPGGNNLITSMMEVQVFCKGYFMSPRGNTIYHRVFKGLSSHVSHTDNGKTLEVSIQLRGILRFMEMMQIETHPALVTNSNQNAEIYTTNQWNMDPYEQIADTFVRSLSVDAFQLNTIASAGQTVAGSEWATAVKADYVQKWQTILHGVLADVHIMGYIFGTVPLRFNGVTTQSAKDGFKDPLFMAEAINLKGKLAESDSLRDTYVNMIRGYTPDFGVSQVQLVNGRIVPRLERIRSVLHNIGFEGFQDINGEIIFKAPLYNLDVTNVTKVKATLDQTNPSPIDTITDTNNPFVVFLPEIENEQETEDEGAIRCTRMSVQGVYSRGLQYNVSGEIRAVASHIDIPKLSRFGLREEPARTIPWVAENDKFLLYTYAVNELVRENRGWRTYSFTTPLRPELRLGFPMYIPHKDFYGYIKSVTISYNTGGAANMQVVLDAIRKRPMFPSTRKLVNQIDPATGVEREETILTTLPNLVMRWTTPPKSGDNTTTTSKQTARPSADGDVPNNDPSVNPVNTSTTQVIPQDKPKPNAETVQFSDYRKLQIGSDWQTRSDTYTHNFRVQNDTFGNGPDKAPSGQPFFSRDNWLKPRQGANGQITGIDVSYMQAIVNMQPYTDEKGYEIVGVFPLGRWKSLQEAYKESREGKVVDYVSPQDQKLLSTQDAMIFAGLGTPSFDSAGQLKDTFDKIMSTVSSSSSFELDYSNQRNAPVFAEKNILHLQQPDNQVKPISDLALAITDEGDVQQRVDLFLSGTPPVLPSTKQQLQIVNDNTDSPTDFSTVVSDFQQLGHSSE